MQGMQNVFNPMANLYQTQLEASRQFADALFSGTERIDHVLLDATHRAWNEQLKFAQSLVAVKDAQGVANAQAAFFSQRPDHAMESQRELIRVVTEVQTELGKSMRNYFEQLGTSAAGSASAAVGVAERQASQAYNPVGSMFSLWESALREMTTMASRTMPAARSHAEGAASTAYQRAAGAADETAEAMSAGRERKSGHSNGKRK